MSSCQGKVILIATGLKSESGVGTLESPFPSTAHPLPITQNSLSERILRRKRCIKRTLSGFKVGFIMLKSSNHHQVAFNRRRVTEFPEMPAYTVSPADWLLAKLIRIQDYQSAVQLQDLRNLLEITTLDKAHIAPKGFSINHNPKTFC